MFTKNNFIKKRHRIIISLTSGIFLLILNVSPVFAGEISLNSKISVKIPESQSGNPGEFVTFTLELENRDNLPLSLEVSCENPPNWNVLYEPGLMVPAHSRSYFPVSVQIPQNTPSGTQNLLMFRFKLKESLAFPVISVPISVNPLSSIIFEPDSLVAKGSPGSAVHYQITVTNNGNTAEEFSVKYHSENSWKTKVEPVNFWLSPGESLKVTVEHSLPSVPAMDFDALNITFSWNQNQKTLQFTSMIDTPMNRFTDGFYIWQGGFRFSHPDLSSLNSYPVYNSFALSGQIGPELYSEFYFSDLFGYNARGFLDLKYPAGSIRAGKFSLAWPGLMTPSSSLGAIYTTNQINGHNYSLYTWHPGTPDDNTTAVGIETVLTDQSKLRFLYDPQTANRQSMLEYSYSNLLPSRILWSNELAYNIANPANFGYSFSLTGPINNWYWHTNFDQIMHHFNYIRKQNAAIIVGRPLSPSNRFSQEYQLHYELGETTFNYYDLLLTITYRTSADFELIFSDKYHCPNNDVSSNNTSLFMKSGWKQGLFRNDWWLTSSFDIMPDGFSKYTKLNWLTAYPLTKNSDLLLNPQWIDTSLANTADDQTKLGLGYQKRWEYGPELTASLYYVFNTVSNWNVQFTLDWPVYQYHLIFTYSGFIGAASVRNDICSISFNHDIIVPVRRPLGNITGTAFLDINRNGIMEPGEPSLRRLELLLDHDRPFTTDNKGHYNISGIVPGEHWITLNPLLEEIYQPSASEIKLHVKPYQTLQLNIPFIRNQNIIGHVYIDKNKDLMKDSNETSLADIWVVLSNKDGAEVSRARTDQTGTFVFYQLIPEKYQIKIDEATIPEDLSLPPGIIPMDIHADRLQDLPVIEIGLIPYERPVEIVNETSSKLELTLNREIIYTGQTLQVTVTSSSPLKNISLYLPDNTEPIKLKNTPGQIKWTYSWKIPPTTPVGQTKLRVEAVEQDGNKTQAEINCIILRSY